MKEMHYDMASFNRKLLRSISTGMVLLLGSPVIGWVIVMRQPVSLQIGSVTFVVKRRSGSVVRFSQDQLQMIRIRLMAQCPEYGPMKRIMPVGPIVIGFWRCKPA